MKVEGSILYYKSVAGLTTDISYSVRPDNGKKMAIQYFRANGFSTTGNVYLVWDRNGTQETYFASTTGDISIEFDINNPANQFIGDGTRTLNIVLINSVITASPVIGGYVEVVALG